MNIQLNHNVEEFSVSQISQQLKKTVEERFQWVRVRGEISGGKMAASGHYYFSLKDQFAVLDAICWRSSLTQMNVKPEDGLEVICQGRITTYPGRSKYQMVVERFELAGEGALLKLIEERKKRLSAQGYFDQAYKKTIPFLPKTIGVITSPTGAVIRDILHRISERFPSHVILWPVLVQGEGAAEQMRTAITGFDTNSHIKPDVIILARGGGSIEDLMAFNDEALVKAVATCSIPIIAAIGHETDWTLCDYAASLRAPTPTAAAEKAVPVRQDLFFELQKRHIRLQAAQSRILIERQQYLTALIRGLPHINSIWEQASLRFDERVSRFLQSYHIFFEKKYESLHKLALRLPHPREWIIQKEQTLNNQTRLLEVFYRQLLERMEKRFYFAQKMLDNLSYHRVLERGFALVFDDNKHMLSSQKQVCDKKKISIQFYDGEVKARILNPPQE